jgi:sugar phosphate isomerase/epimerase
MTGRDRFRISAFGDEIAPDLETQIAVLRRHDVRFLEVRAAWGLDIAEFSDDDLGRARERLTAHGIGVSAIASPVGKAPVDADFDAERGRFRRALAAARRLDTALVRIFSFFVPGGRYRAARDEVVRRLAAFAREAEQAHVTLALENESYVYGDTAERCLDVVEAVGSAALRMTFDPANFVQVGVRPYAEAWPLLKPYVVHVHIKDAVAVDRSGLPPYPERIPGERLMDSVRLPGEGQGEVRSLLHALSAEGYNGFLTVEPHLGRRLPEQDGQGRLRAAVVALRALILEVKKDMP